MLASATGYRTQRLLLLLLLLYSAGSRREQVGWGKSSCFFLSFPPPPTATSTCQYSYTFSPLYEFKPPFTSGLVFFFKDSNSSPFSHSIFPIDSLLVARSLFCGGCSRSIPRSYLLAVRGFASYHPTLPVSLSVHSVVRSSQFHNGFAGEKNKKANKHIIEHRILLVPLTLFRIGLG